MTPSGYESKKNQNVRHINPMRKQLLDPPPLSRPSAPSSRFQTQWGQAAEAAAEAEKHRQEEAETVETPRLPQKWIRSEAPKKCAFLVQVHT